MWLAPYVDLIFPPSCAFCHGAMATGREGLLCSACCEQLADRRAACTRCGSVIVERADSASDCRQCRGRRFHFDAAIRLGGYEGFRRSAVLRIKRSSERNLAVSLGNFLAAAERDRLRAMALDGIVPVPMHWSRRVWRGTNSPETIAECIARTLGLPLAPHLLSRRRRTAPQASLAPSKRRANVRGAFRAARHPDLPGARLLLVDDIMTTGATLNEGAKELRRAGAGFVAVAVVARAEGMA
jgi:ComF family protein